jgi:hypothetical protein
MAKTENNKKEDKVLSEATEVVETTGLMTPVTKGIAEDAEGSPLKRREYVRHSGRKWTLEEVIEEYHLTELTNFIETDGILKKAEALNPEQLETRVTCLTQEPVVMQSGIAQMWTEDKLEELLLPFQYPDITGIIVDNEKVSKAVEALEAYRRETEKDEEKYNAYIEALGEVYTSTTFKLTSADKEHELFAHDEEDTEDFYHSLMVTGINGHTHVMMSSIPNPNVEGYEKNLEYWKGTDPIYFDAVLRNGEFKVDFLDTSKVTNKREGTTLRNYLGIKKGCYSGGVRWNSRETRLMYAICTQNNSVSMVEKISYLKPFFKNGFLAYEMMLSMTFLTDRKISVIDKLNHTAKAISEDIGQLLVEYFYYQAFQKLEEEVAKTARDREELAETKAERIKAAEEEAERLKREENERKEEEARQKQEKKARIKAERKEREEKERQLKKEAEERAKAQEALKKEQQKRKRAEEKAAVEAEAKRKEEEANKPKKKTWRAPGHYRKKLNGEMVWVPSHTRRLWSWLDKTAK